MLSPIIIAAIIFVAWIVYLAGLAALQHNCDDGVNAFSAVNNGLPCSKTYRFYWFLFAWEFVMVMILAIVGVTRRLPHSRAAIVGMFAISTVLFIWASNNFLDASNNSPWNGGKPQRYIRTAIAGSIMLAAFNALAVLVLGTKQKIMGSRTEKAAGVPATGTGYGATGTGYGAPATAPGYGAPATTAAV